MENTQDPNQPQTPPTEPSTAPATTQAASTPATSPPAETSPVATSTPSSPPAVTTSTAPAAPAPSPSPSAPSDGQVPDIKKTYYKTFSPRLLGIAFSYAIDKDRAKMAAKNKGYAVPENPLVLETGNMFWGELMVEVQNANAQDSNVVDLTQKEVAVGGALSELETKAGKKAVQTYTLHQGTETKTVAVF